MLINLLAWIYISFICLAWGNMLLTLVTGTPAAYPSTPASPSPFNQAGQADFPIVCLAGLSVIGALACWISLCTPLQWQTQALLLPPAIAWCFREKNRRQMVRQSKEAFSGLSRPGILLWTASVLMTLVLSSHLIIQPDTIHYHARSILVFEKAGAIPGIANVRNELGLQSLWFAALAICKGHNASGTNIIFANGAILCWYFLFVIRRIAPSGKSSRRSSGRSWIWMILFAFTLVNWTAVRMTAASPSPDFIIFLFGGAALWMFACRSSLRPADSFAPGAGPRPASSPRPETAAPASLILCLLFCFTAVAIKLSAALLLLLPLTILGKAFLQKNYRICLTGTVLGAFILLPWLARNYIASGWLLYPYPFPDIFHPAWKMPAVRVNAFNHYISTYARFPYDLDKALHSSHIPFGQWVPDWWQQITGTARALLLSIPSGLVLLPFYRFFSGRRHPFLRTVSVTIAGMTTLAGSILWFVKAPDPRFGLVFLLPLFYILYFPWIALLHDRLLANRPKTGSLVYKGMMGAFLAALLSYSAYRSVYFLSPRELIFPAGITKEAYDDHLGCSRLSVDFLNNRLGGGPSPESECPFAPLGTTPSEGFRPQPPPDRQP